MIKLLLAAAVATIVHAGEVTITMTGASAPSSSNDQTIKNGISAAAAGAAVVLSASDISVTNDGTAITAVITTSSSDQLKDAFCVDGAAGVLEQGITALGFSVSDLAVDGCAGGLGAGAIVGIIIAVVVVLGLGFFIYKKKKGGRGAPDNGMESAA